MRFIDYERLCQELLAIIPIEEQKRVFSSDGCELCSEFLGFISFYEALSRIIPKGYTVIDFGAAHNPQSYYFKGCNYIAVQPKDVACEMFCPEWCKIYRCTTGEFIKHKNEYLSGIDADKIFAICNYVPNWYGENSMDLVKANFQNVFTFYPCSMLV